MRKGVEFQWNENCEKVFTELKKVLMSPLVLSKSKENKMLFLYLVVSNEVVCAVLVRKISEGLKMVYYTNRDLQGVELKYPRVEKIVYALLLTAQRLKHYF